MFRDAANSSSQPVSAVVGWRTCPSDLSQGPGGASTQSPKTVTTTPLTEPPLTTLSEISPCLDSTLFVIFNQNDIHSLYCAWDRVTCREGTCVNEQ